MDIAYDYRVTTVQGSLLTNNESKAFTAGLVSSLLNLPHMLTFATCAHGSDKISKEVIGLEKSLALFDVNKIVAHFQVTVMSLPDEMRACD